LVEKPGISDSHCGRLLGTGKIKGIKLGHDWVVRELKYKRKRKPKKEGRAMRKLSNCGAGDGTRTRDNLLGRQGYCRAGFSPLFSFRKVLKTVLFNR